MALSGKPLAPLWGGAAGCQIGIRMWFCTVVLSVVCFAYFHHERASMVAVEEQLLHSLVAPVETTYKVELLPYRMLHNG